jgi:hypothetical protein
VSGTGRDCVVGVVPALAACRMANGQNLVALSSLRNGQLAENGAGSVTS